MRQHYRVTVMWKCFQLLILGIKFFYKNGIKIRVSSFKIKCIILRTKTETSTDCIYTLFSHRPKTNLSSKHRPNFGVSIQILRRPICILIIHHIRYRYYRQSIQSRFRSVKKNRNNLRLILSKNMSLSACPPPSFLSPGNSKITNISGLQHCHCHILPLFFVI